MNLNLSKHAERRSNQRGANHQTIAIIASLADRTTHVGGGVVYKYLTRKRVTELCEEGLFVAADCERLTRTSILMNPITGEVVSVLKGGRAAHGLKRYRRGQWSHQKSDANDNDRGHGDYLPAT